MKNTLTFLLVLLLCTSCSIFHRHNVLDEELQRREQKTPEQLEAEKKQRAFETEVQRRFDLVRRLIDERQFDDVDEIMASLEPLTEYKADIDELKRLISLASTADYKKTDIAINQRRILNEAEHGLTLPKTYGQTIEITPETVEMTMPVGPLEQLLTKKVSMKVNKMPLADLALQLKDIDGVNIADPANIIMSDAIVKDKTLSCNFKDVPLYEVFQYISRNLGVAFNVSEHLIWVTTTAKDTTGFKLETRVIPLKHGFVPKVPQGIGVTGKTAFDTVAEVDNDLEEALKDFFSKTKTGGSYKLFPNRNVLVLRDTRENLRILEHIVTRLDRPPLQVVIESKFISVSESDLFDLGVEITKRNGGKTGAQYPANNNGETDVNLSNFFTELGAIKTQNPEGVGALMISGILGNRSYDMLISALESKSSAVTLSAPRVTVMNNRTARIRKGDKYYYFEEYALQSVDKGNNGIENVLVPRGKPTSLQTGITLEVKVNVGNDERTIMLGLKPEIIKLLDWEDYSSTNSQTVNKTTTEYTASIHLPRTNEQGVATSVSIHSGETVVLGGMMEHTKTRYVAKVPVLGSIPFIGWMFRHTEERETPVNLLIFVTAHVINEKGEYVKFNPPIKITPKDIAPLVPPQQQKK